MPKLSFFKTFFSAAIVEAALVVYAVYRNFYEFDFTKIFTWAVLVCIPVLVGIVAVIISLIQNATHRKKKHHVAEKNKKV